jgi:mono/diheme cytochrome c family protein
LQTKILIGLALTVFIVVFMAFYWATEPGRQEAALDRQIAEAAERGAELYVTHCASCHGSGGEGRAGAALKNSPLEEDILEKVISRGVPGTVMPPLAVEEGGSLRHHEIRDLIVLIKNWDDALLPSPEEMARPTSSQLVGDDLYAAECAICHGLNREGIGGFAPALTALSLSSRTDAEVKAAIVDGIPGTAMPPFKGRFTDEEIEVLLQFTKYGP